MPRPLDSDRTVMLWLCTFVTCVTLFFSQGAITDGSDGRSMYEVAKSVVERESLAIDARYGFAGRDGRYYAYHGPGLPLVTILPYAMTRSLVRLGSFGDGVTEGVVASLVPLITGLLAAVLYRLSRRLGADAPNALIVALGTVLGTYLLAFSKEFFSEPLAALCLVLAVERAVGKRPIAAGFAAGAAALTRQQYFAVFPIL